jgi:uncharacterized protein YegP (UPF0339 family)
VAGKFVLIKGSTGKYHFKLVAADGQVIAASEAYERKQAALNGIDLVKENAPGQRRMIRPANRLRKPKVAVLPERYRGGRLRHRCAVDAPRKYLLTGTCLFMVRRC